MESRQSPLLPIGQSERAAVLDALRGFALLGILLDNIFSFTGYGFWTMDQRAALPTFYPDVALGLGELAFVHGKFYSIFSMLFGIGFSITLLRGKAKKVNPYRIFYRRLFVLLLIGLVHLVFVWEGDILVLYALIGLVLPLFRKLSDKALLWLAACLVLSPLLIDVVKVLLHTHVGGFLQDMAMAKDKANGIPQDDTFGHYLFGKQSGWAEWRNWQASGYLYRYAYLLDTNRFPKVLGMFLVGLWAGRKMVYRNLEDYTLMFRRLRKWGFIIGIPFSLAMAAFEIDDHSVPDPMGLLDTIFYAFGVVPLSMAYVSVLCLAWIRSNGQGRWKWLAPAGRMALTNYLSQTIICIFIFYGVGLGLGGNIGPSVFIPFVLLLYTFQVFISTWWLKRFNYGPVEWLWRMLTYGKVLPLKRT